MKELTIKIKWKLYQLGDILYINSKKVTNDYNKYASRGMEGRTYSRGGFQAWKRNQWRGYKVEDES